MIFRWDLNNDYTLWSGLIGGFFLSLGYFGCDQSQVQRYLTARSLKQSRLSLIFNAFVKVPMQFFILAIGVLLFVFYHFERPPLIFNPAEREQLEASQHGHKFTHLQQEYRSAHQARKEATLILLEARKSGEDFHIRHGQIRNYNQKLSTLRRQSKDLVEKVRGAASNDVNYVFPTYLIHYVPAGILGLMIAVIFAAAMSSLDSEITALSSVTVHGLLQPVLDSRGPPKAITSGLRAWPHCCGDFFAVGVALYGRSPGVSHRSRQSSRLLFLRLSGGSVSARLSGEICQRRRCLLGAYLQHDFGCSGQRLHRYFLALLQSGRSDRRASFRKPSGAIS